ncbi:MAG: hypothetical protein ABSD89_15435 [Halobacteriota archaeon]
MTFDEKQKAEALESFSSVMALYQTLRGNPSALRVRRVATKGGEVVAEAIDFLIDIELKAGRVLSYPDYFQWLRLADTENYTLVPEENKVAMGRTWKEYGLTEEGAYRMLYFREKNNQMRGYLMKGRLNGDGFPETGTDTEATGTT